MLTDAQPILARGTLEFFDEMKAGRICTQLTLLFKKMEGESGGGSWLEVRDWPSPKGPISRLGRFWRDLGQTSGAPQTQKKPTVRNFLRPQWEAPILFLWARGFF